jgi:hypothetical protein
MREIFILHIPTHSKSHQVIPINPLIIELCSVAKINVGSAQSHQVIESHFACETSMNSPRTSNQHKTNCWSLNELSVQRSKSRDEFSPSLAVTKSLWGISGELKQGIEASLPQASPTPTKTPLHPKQILSDSFKISLKTSKIVLI